MLARFFIDRPILAWVISIVIVLFGAIAVGARTGRILYAHLTHGNWGTEQRYETVADIRAVVKSWAALQHN